MANEVYIEKRKRGFFGWLFLIVFIGWNILMILWIIGWVKNMGELPDAQTDAETAGRAIGAGIGLTFILIVWALGSVVTGLLALLTRGSKTIVKRQ